MEKDYEAKFVCTNCETERVLSIPCGVPKSYFLEIQRTDHDSYRRTAEEKEDGGKWATDIHTCVFCGCYSYWELQPVYDQQQQEQSRRLKHTTYRELTVDGANDQTIVRGGCC